MVRAKATATARGTATRARKTQTEKKPATASKAKTATRTAKKEHKEDQVPDIEDLLRPERLTISSSSSDEDKSTRGKATAQSKSVKPEKQADSQHDDAVDKLRIDLLTWFDENRRLLPWRGDRAGDYLGKSLAEVPEDARETPRRVDPYETWVSEIMLQQTRVETVIDYFTKWMKRFPTPQALAEASPDEVNASWAGLGYYRRARNLHAGAQRVTEEFDGKLPSEVADLLKVQGIGAYTAGAIASIAFGRAVPLVDGNVIRVFARLFAVGAEAKAPSLIKGCWSLAASLVDPKRPGDFNQALMELGATICKPRGAACEACPVRSCCRAYALDPTQVHEYPLKAKAKVLPVQTYAVGLVKRSSQRPDGKGADEFLVCRRPSTGLLAGQWEFLMARSATTSPTMPKRRSLVNDALKALDETIAPCRSCITEATREDRGLHEHTFSHLQHRLLIEKISLPSDRCATCKTSNENTSVDREDEVKIVDDISQDEVQVVSEGASAKDTAPASSEVTWMTLGELQERGMTASTSKCLILAEELEAKPTKAKARKPKTGTSTKKRKADGPASEKDSKQQQLRMTAFFSNGSKSKSSE
ncbi:Adenine DNA glycosylase [Hondaea fermentalgiana]|uniref:Adenine DNA glycosylase n=1 Tax=Hondaea fermentalgiana TaxID=2315210 RepID=A0A2R5GF03_9STRA|nr:Adenine DNA glycosylase [Hondaea fermentalgiana]|eukprot:GBG28308.1 Adenine DNA glycosylase [Hondaea fermentalgiana]